MKPKPVRPPRFASARTIGALILREMNTSYGKSPLGYLWAVLEPVGGIAIMSLVFSAAFRHPALGQNFPIFYATGFMPFQLFVGISAKLGQSLNYSRPFLAYPRITFMDTILARFTLGILTDLMVSYIVFGGLLMAFETRTTLELPRIGLAYAMAASLGFGFGTLNCFLFSISSTWQKVWSIVTRPLFIVSGIFFLYEGVPEPYRSFLWYNPLFHVAGEMRAAFYSSYEAHYVNPYYVFGISLFMSVLGILFLRRYHKWLVFN